MSKTPDHSQEILKGFGVLRNRQKIRKFRFSKP
jgi:hypothetical protein